MAGPFETLPRTPANHFRLYLFAAVFRLVYWLHRLAEARGEEPEQIDGRFPFLRSYLDQLRPYMPAQLTWSQSQAWWREAIEQWEEAGTSHLPLLTMPELDYSSRLALLLVGLVEEDSRFGNLYAWLQQPVGQRRPTLEVVERLVAGDRLGSDGTDRACRRLLAAGLVTVADRTAPRPEWALAIPEAIWDVLQGEADLTALPWCDHRPAESLPAIDEPILPDDLRRQLTALPALLAKGQIQLLVLRGSAGSERLEVAGTVARAMGLGLIAVDGAVLASGNGSPLGALCTMTRSMPVIQYDLAPGETAGVPLLPGYHGPIAVLLGTEGGLRGAMAHRSVTLTLPVPTQALRRRFWAEALGEHAGPELEEIAARFHLPGGYIRQAGAMAINQAALDGRTRVTLPDVRLACRMLNRQVLDTLAVCLEPRGSWAEMVVSQGTMQRLHELELRCRHRERLLEHVSPLISASGNRGVRALFGGPSGTGKTMAARTLAAVLGMDIYRVDLAAVINKYIGETEKNLHQVLSRAEELDVILLLDEGDTLLAKRSDVKSANDRYANLETNYLLQRLEHYQGIVLVTTNAPELIDPAFQRRMDVVVNFLPPDVEERAQILRLHLPAGHRVPEEHLEEVAIRCALTGGQIRNAATLASLLALESGGPLTRHDLDEAIQSEYRKAGAISPLCEVPVAGESRVGIEAFMEAMRDEP